MDCLEAHHRVQKRASELVAEAVNTQATEFKSRFGLEVFTSREVLDQLRRDPEWIGLEVTQPQFFKLVSKQGWVRCVLSFRGAHLGPRRIKAWVKKQQP